MKAFHYKPSDGFLADVIPFYWDGAYHLFYLHDYRNIEEHGEGVDWRQVVTRDFVHFEEKGDMLLRGELDEQDLFVFTGSVLRAKGQFHIFYTGHNHHLIDQGKPQEAVMHAVSDDLIHWQKRPEEKFFAPDGYEMHDWRDPFVFYDANDGKHHMLLCARPLNGPEKQRGCTAHCISDDLVHWETLEPLWAPELYFAHECPDLFQMGDWYYLIYSEFTFGCKTRYVKSRALYGPWEAPIDDTFDSRAYYAAKTASDGQKRYLFGWNPTRSGDVDEKPFQWGGTLITHELWQDENGDLHVKMPDDYQKAFDREIDVAWETHRNACESGGEWVLDCSHGYAGVCTQKDLPQVCLVTADVELKDALHFVIRMRYDQEEDFSYAMLLHPAAKQISFRYMPNNAWGHLDDYGLQCILPDTPDGKFRVKLLLSYDIATLYVNDRIALNSRMCAGSRNALAFSLAHGKATVRNVKVFVPSEQ